MIAKIFLCLFLIVHAVPVSVMGYEVCYAIANGHQDYLNDEEVLVIPYPNQQWLAIRQGSTGWSILKNIDGQMVSEVGVGTKRGREIVHFTLTDAQKALYDKYF